MEASLVENIPSLETFLQYSSNQIKEFCEQFDIKTSYLPVDGTRRHFILFNDSINEWDENQLNLYYHHVNEKFREIISIFYDYGIKDLIILLMDESAFTRGKTFLLETIKNGISPLYHDQAYLDLYEKYNVDVLFSGFNDVYARYYDQSLLDDLEHKFQKVRKENADRKLIVYTGLTPSEDYLLLENYAQKLRKENLPVSRENLIKKIYRTDLSMIDFSIWFGYPRDKITPPLLWENGSNFYIKNPTLTINPIQIKKAIYFTAKTKNSIKDKYFFHKFSEQDKKRIQNEILEEDSIMGPDYYY